MKKAFTLVELLGVIIILGVLALIVFPIIDKSIKSSKEKALQATIASIEDAANKYSVEHDLGYSTVYNKIGLNELVNSGYLKDELINPVTNSKLNGCVLYKWDEEYKQYEFKYDEECEIISTSEYVDKSGANPPKLLNNMIPIKYDGENWVYTKTEQTAWYNYDKKEWANAVVLNSNVSKNVGDTITEDDIALWYVWIPRYKYKLFGINLAPKEIEISFENGTETTGNVKCYDSINSSNETSELCENDDYGNWYTHPAFTFGEQELTGFWVGKFETRKIDNNIIIKPNISMLDIYTHSGFFYDIQDLNATYSLNGDSHMMKNMEWGAVSYLSHSKYGTCTDGNCVGVGKNNNSDFITGCGSSIDSGESNTCNAYNTVTGMLASTTQNIYGVYDMNGGTAEYVMGIMVDSNGNIDFETIGFNTIPETKYYDIYTYDSDFLTFHRGKLGDATKEIIYIDFAAVLGWYNSRALFPYSDKSWFTRGGFSSNSYSGLFNYEGDLNYVFSTRAILCSND